jgi:hypothetical protein
LASDYDLEIEQIYIKTAFQYWDHDALIYIELREGFQSSESAGMVCNFLKPAYGLKQAPRVWVTTLCEFLIKQKMQ